MENRSIAYMLFSFQGRMSRSEYWLRYTIPLLLLYVVMFVLVTVLSLVFGVAQFVAQLLGSYTMSNDAPDLTAMVVVGFILIMLLIFASGIAFLGGDRGPVKRLRLQSDRLVLPADLHPGHRTAGDVHLAWLFPRHGR